MHRPICPFFLRFCLSHACVHYTSPSRSPPSLLPTSLPTSLPANQPSTCGCCTCWSRRKLPHAWGAGLCVTHLRCAVAIRSAASLLHVLLLCVYASGESPGTARGAATARCHASIFTPVPAAGRGHDAFLSMTTGTGCDGQICDPYDLHGWRSFHDPSGGSLSLTNH